ncbi:unnamed protein product [Penicillium egyptiacum]|uniref:Uncharacterized protein n=1 Tax=Penicillium egyptiacum TaxID=1303716 RepID=A0A9W4KEN5_9EURO|nr:unnamed protein product [Penicillium egyptiacum]
MDADVDSAARADPDLDSGRLAPINEDNDEELAESIERDDEPSLPDHHVQKLIWQETNRHYNLVYDFFDDETTSAQVDDEATRAQDVAQFFTNLNRKIRLANIRQGVASSSGCINAQLIIEAVRLWKLRLSKASGWRPEKLMAVFDNTYKLINAYNKKFYLPEGWNINPLALESMLSPSNMRTLFEMAASNTYKRGPPAAHHDPTEANLTEFQRLEARAQNEQRAISSGEVLYWWKKGTGYQTFVKYGDVDPVYRIRSGSYESFDRREVEQVLSSESRGTQKRTFRGTDGIKVQDWVWTRDQVADILGVGWKVPDDDDGEVDPLSLIVPEPGAVYPETRVIVLWNDEVTTLETRTFVRRISAGPNRNGDNIIYQKALEVEQTHGNNRPWLSEDESDEESDTASQASETPEDNPPERRTKQHSQPRQTRQSTPLTSRAPKYGRGHSTNMRRGESEKTPRYRQSSYQARDLRRDIEKLTRQLAQLEDGSRKPRRGTRR